MRIIPVAVVVALLLASHAASQVVVETSRAGPGIQLLGNATLAAAVAQEGTVTVTGGPGGDAPRVAVRPTAVFEFQDLDGDGHFGLGDPVVQRIPFTDLPLRRVAQQDGGLRLRFDLEARNVHLDLHPAANQSDGPALSMDWRIEGFPFATDNRTHLALETRVTGGRLESRQSIEADNGTWRLAWSWDAAEANVTLVPYANSGGGETMVAFSMPRDDAVRISTAWHLHERVPAEAGRLALPDLRVGDARVFAIATLAAAAAVGGSAYRVMKRER